jgi:endonuclease YncB( thermonuclease family)
MMTRMAADLNRTARYRFRAAALLLALCLPWTAAVSVVGSSQAADHDRRYTVVKVYDGDTILAAGSGERLLVRLLGIDAPETAKGRGKPGQPYSQQARRHLAGLILNRSVTLSVYGRDRYHRLLAVVHCNDRDINEAMIQAGLAEVYRGRTPEGFDKTDYLSSEAKARKTRTGMWRQGGAYLSPLRWKHP